MAVREIKTRKVIEQERVVEALEQHLEMAKRGEIQAIGIVSVIFEGGVGTQYYAGDRFHELLGGFAEMQIRMYADAREDEV